MKIMYIHRNNSYDLNGSESQWTNPKSDTGNCPYYMYIKHWVYMMYPSLLWNVIYFNFSASETHFESVFMLAWVYYCFVG